MKSLLSCLCLIFFIPLTIYARITSEIIFIPGTTDRLLITRMNNTENVGVFFGDDTLLYVIWILSVQRNGNFIVVIASERGEFAFNEDAYLIDTIEVPAKPRKLTHHRFDNVFAISISPNGDIVFTNSLDHDEDPPPKHGIYFISHRELNKVLPKIILLKEVIAGDVVWSPDNEHIAYTTVEGVFIFNIKTEKTLHVSQVGATPVFSPDGKKFAFSSRGWRIENQVAREISILSFPTLRHLRTIKGLIKHTKLMRLKWSPNGKYIVYQSSDQNNISYTAVPLNGGPPEEILNESSVYEFDWSSRAYSVDPENRVTTVWGELKAGNIK